MTVLEGVHADHGATFTDLGGRRVVATYGRTDRVHHAVRKVVGVIEHGFGVVVVSGEDRVDFVDNAVSNRVPSTDGQGCYALLLDPQGRIESDLYVYNAGERLLCFCPPDRAPAIAEDWADKTFIQDVSVRAATDEFATFGIHGPKATEKVASVVSTQTPDEPLSFVRGAMGDAGVTVIRDDGLTGEEGYEVVCAADDAERAFDTLVNHGLNATPFGYDTWETLTLEAGTPLFHSELRDRVPNVAGIRNALDFEKGCYVGQEVVSRVENQGRPSQYLVGLLPEAVPEAGAAVFDGDEHVGEVTRAAESPMREEPIAMAAVDSACETDALSVRFDGDEVAATRTALPFVEGSDDSARRPRYPDR